MISKNTEWVLPTIILSIAIIAIGLMAYGIIRTNNELEKKELTCFRGFVVEKKGNYYVPVSEYTPLPHMISCVTEEEFKNQYQK